MKRTGLLIARGGGGSESIISIKVGPVYQFAFFESICLIKLSPVNPLVGKNVISFSLKPNSFIK